MNCCKNSKKGVSIFCKVDYTGYADRQKEGTAGPLCRGSNVPAAQCNQIKSWKGKEIHGSGTAVSACAGSSLRERV